MPPLSTYLRNHLDKPLRKYCKQKNLTRGQVINEMIEEKLSMEGFKLVRK